MGRFLDHIQDNRAVPALHALSRFIEDASPTDEAIPRPTALIETKMARLVDLACLTDVGVSQTRRLTRVRSAQS